MPFFCYNPHMSKESLIPLEEAQTDRINTRGLVLPPYIKGKIGIDIDRTVRLMNIGGIGYLHVKTSDKDVSNTETKIENHGKNLITKGSLWKAVSLELHEKGIIERTQNTYGTIASPTPWAKTINKELRDTIKKEGIKFSLSVPKGINIYDYLADSFQIFNSYKLIHNGVTGITLTDASLLESSMPLLVFESIQVIYKIIDPRYRMDILRTPQIGRAFWTAFRANTAYRNLIVATSR